MGVATSIYRKAKHSTRKRERRVDAFESAILFLPGCRQSQGRDVIQEQQRSRSTRRGNRLKTRTNPDALKTRHDGLVETGWLCLLQRSSGYKTRAKAFVGR